MLVGTLVQGVQDEIGMCQVPQGLYEEPFAFKVGERTLSVCCFVNGADCCWDLGKLLEELPQYTR